MDSGLQLIVYGMAFLALVIAWASGRVASPLAALAARWLRWLSLSVLGAALLTALPWFNHPFWVLALVCALIWFLVETGYNWLAISALSRSDYPLFPRFQENTAGDEWPNQRDSISIRNWLRKNDFKKVMPLVASVGEQILVRVSVFVSNDRSTRLSVLFFPNAYGSHVSCFSLHSRSSDGTLIVTDNIFLPFGGFYPEMWMVERRPWIRDLERLHALHAARVDAYATSFMPIEGSPLEALNEEQRELESLNRHLGFLSLPEEREAEGRISSAGRYRVWQELWMLNYMGRSLRY